MDTGKRKKQQNKQSSCNNYSQDNVYKALKEIEDNGTTTRKAAAMFGVPRSTIYAKLKSYIPVEAARGPSSYLSYKEERLVVDWMFYCSERGFPISKDLLLQSVQKLVKQLKRQTPFKDDKPGRHWWEGFCRRHPDVTCRIAQNLSTSRVSASEDVLRKWFSEVKTHLQKNDLLEIESSRFYNLDESAFFLVPKADKVLARKGSKSVYKVISGDEKESITVLFNVNAAGIVLPPLILFWYERIPTAVTRTLPPGWIAGSTERGWMTAELFYNYITTNFYPWLLKNEIKLPVVLFVDGHVSHLTLELSKFCKEKGIELIALYPNATHILQPLDVAVFHPLKLKWKKCIDEWRVENGTQKLKREYFAPLLKKTLDNMPNLNKYIQNGFKTCGLFPFNSEAVDFNILNKEKTVKVSEINKPKESDENVNGDTSRNIEDQRISHLQHLESTMSEEVLSDFKNAVINQSFQVMNVVNEGLFNYWLDLQNLSSK